MFKTHSFDPATLPLPSLFENLLMPDSRGITLEEMQQLSVSDPFLQRTTAQARQALANGNQTGYTVFKKQLYAVSVAGHFEGGRTMQHFGGLTGLSLVDVDHLSSAEEVERLRTQAVADPHTVACFVTPSGLGLRILFRYTGEPGRLAYTLAWHMGNDYFSLLLGTPVDSHVSDVSRLSFLPHDPRFFLRPSAEAVPFFVPAEPSGCYDTLRDFDAMAAEATRLVERAGLRCQ
ncbi:MAG: hypothetical protein IJ684_06055, partial [Bacteroidales bacterium]|nr:hypothetical protein [Bacteroidales bacterium]